MDWLHTWHCVAGDVLIAPVAWNVPPLMRESGWLFRYISEACPHPFCCGLARRPFFPIFALLCLMLLAGSLQAQPTVDTDEDSPLRFGTPDTGRLMRHRGVVFSYDGRLRSARWVAERLTKEELADDIESELEAQVNTGSLVLSPES